MDSLSDVLRFTKGFVSGASPLLKHSSRRSNAVELLSKRHPQRGTLGVHLKVICRSKP